MRVVIGHYYLQTDGITRYLIHIADWLPSCLFRRWCRFPAPAQGGSALHRRGPGSDRFELRQISDNILAPLDRPKEEESAK